MAHNPRYGNWTPAMWRDRAPTLADLRHHRFLVIARCRVCDLPMAVRLTVTADALGWDYRLWGKTVPCRRWRCSGRMAFWCFPPQTNQAIEMF